MTVAKNVRNYFWDCLNLNNLPNGPFGGEGGGAGIVRGWKNGLRGVLEHA